MTGERKKASYRFGLAHRGVIGECLLKTLYGDLRDWKGPFDRELNRREILHGGHHVVDVAVPYGRDGQTREWVVKGVLWRSKDVVDVSTSVVLLGTVIPTTPDAVDDELVRDLLAPWNLDGTRKPSVAFDQMNGSRPLPKKVSCRKKKAR